MAYLVEYVEVSLARLLQSDSCLLQKIGPDVTSFGVQGQVKADVHVLALSIAIKK